MELIRFKCGHKSFVCTHFKEGTTEEEKQIALRKRGENNTCDSCSKRHNKEIPRSRRQMGEGLRLLRQSLFHITERKVNIDSVSKAAGITRGCLTKIERCEQQPTEQQLKDILQFMVDNCIK